MPDLAVAVAGDAVSYTAFVSKLEAAAAAITATAGSLPEDELKR